MIYGLPLRLVKLRAMLGLTQVELAVRIGVNQATVSRWEAGLGAPRAVAMMRIEGLEHEDDRHGQGRMPEYADSVPG